MFFVSRPDESPLQEVERSAKELLDINIQSQQLIINGVLLEYDKADKISEQIYQRQQIALDNRSRMLLDMNTYIVPLRSYNMTGVDNIRAMLSSDEGSVLVDAEISSKDFNGCNR